MSNPSDPSIFWPHFKAAGFLRRALLKPSGKPAVAIDVHWDEPSQTRLDGAAISTEYAIEYEYASAPTLAAGDAVTLLDDDDVPIPKSKFSVRTQPIVPDEWRDDKSGYWRRAVLTKLG